MWNPPIALTLEEQHMAARTRKTRKFFVCLRARRHALLDATFQETLAKTSSRCSPLRRGTDGLISYCFFAFFDVRATVFS